MLLPILFFLRFCIHFLSKRKKMSNCNYLNPCLIQSLYNIIGYNGTIYLCSSSKRLIQKYQRCIIQMIYYRIHAP